MLERTERFQDLKIYRAAFEVQQDIFAISQRFPKTELYSLTDRIRRSSQSVGANISEAWKKRRYTPHFISKLSDADGELAHRPPVLRRPLPTADRPLATGFFLRALCALYGKTGLAFALIRSVFLCALCVFAPLERRTISNGEAGERVLSLPFDQALPFFVPFVPLW